MKFVMNTYLFSKADAAASGNFKSVKDMRVPSDIKGVIFNLDPSQLLPLQSNQRTPFRAQTCGCGDLTPARVYN